MTNPLIDEADAMLRRIRMQMNYSGTLEGVGAREALGLIERFTVALSSALAEVGALKKGNVELCLTLEQDTLDAETAEAQLTALRQSAEQADEFKTALHDLVMLYAQEEIGCVPAPTHEQWDKAWNEAEALVRIEP